MSDSPEPPDPANALHEIVDDHVVPIVEPVEVLDTRRIQQLTTLRRATIRTRSWYLIAAIVLLVAAGELIWKTIRYVQHEHHWGLRPSAFVLIAIAAVLIGSMLLGRAGELKKEIDRPTPEPPQAPPDFSTLSDGSQQWKNLEEISP